MSRGVRVDPNVEKSVPIADLRAVYARHDADLRAVAERTGAKLLDVFPDVCGNGETCSAFFGAHEPKFTDGVLLRPVFVRKHLPLPRFSIDVIPLQLPVMSQAGP